MQCHLVAGSEVSGEKPAVMTVDVLLRGPTGTVHVSVSVTEGRSHAGAQNQVGPREYHTGSGLEKYTRYWASVGTLVFETGTWS